MTGTVHIFRKAQRAGKKLFRENFYSFLQQFIGENRYEYEIVEDHP